MLIIFLGASQGGGGRPGAPALVLVVGYLAWVTADAWPLLPPLNVTTRPWSSHDLGCGRNMPQWGGLAA